MNQKKISAISVFFSEISVPPPLGLSRL